MHTFVHDSYLIDKGLHNYWGYNTIAFFAPHKDYASVPDFGFAEFKEMVARLHDAGIEVILDVVRELGAPTAFELSQRLFPTIEGFSHMLGISEVIGHLDLLGDAAAIETVDGIPIRYACV